MGTSDAYGGSGGRAWGKVRQQASDYADNPTDGNANDLLDALADALDWDGDSENVPNPTEPPRPVQPLYIGGVGLGGGGGGAGGGGGGGGGRTGGAGGGGSGGGGGRSRARAARVGGSVVAAGLAYRNRDESTLRRLNLSLAELDGLDSYGQAKQILAAVGASLGDVQEEELTQASASALLAMLQDDSPTGDDAVRVFVTEYVFEVALTEIGNEFRDGTRDGWATVDEEDKLRNLIEVRVGQVELPATLGPDDIQGAVYTALDDARTFLKARR
jgi:hypothetical protein